MHIAAGVLRVMSALALAFNTNLFGPLTHYSSGQAVVYFGDKLNIPLSFLVPELQFYCLFLSCTTDLPLRISWLFIYLPLHIGYSSKEKTYCHI
jgi:hypothetical protein